MLFFKGIPGSQLSICSCLSFFFGIDSTNQNIYTVRNCIKHNQSTDQRPRRAKKAHLIPNRKKKPDQRFAADSVTWICSLFIRKHVETILNEFHEIKGKPVVNWTRKTAVNSSSNNWNTCAFNEIHALTKSATGV